MWVNCPIIRVFVVFGERVNASGYPCAVFYSVMWVNCPIISILVALEMSKNFRYPCVVFHDIWVVI